jgi:hypothetical protein
MRRLLGQTRAERSAYRNGLTLFFGALLGANLGSLEGLDLKSYVSIVALLAGVVMAFQLIGRARSRAYALVNLGIYAALLGYAILNRDNIVTGLPPGDLDRLLATLVVWLGGLMLVELPPVIDDAPGQAAAEEEN